MGSPTLQTLQDPILLTPWFSFEVVSAGLNFVVMLVDSMLTCSSLYLLHGLYFALYAITFVVFSLVFHAAEGRNEKNEEFIYSTLDWGGAPGAAAVTVALLLFIATPIVYLFLWTTVWVRQRKSDLVKAMTAAADTTRPAA